MAWAVMWWMIRLGDRRDISCRVYVQVACCGVNFGGGCFGCGIRCRYFGCGFGVGILVASETASVSGENSMWLVVVVRLVVWLMK